MKFIKKYEPRSFNDCVFSDQATADRLHKYCAGERTGDVLLWGPVGTGKTSIAKVLADQISGGGVFDGCALNLLYHGGNLSKSDLETMWSTLQSSWKMLASGGQPCIVIDELDEMPLNAQRQLKVSIDKFAEFASFVVTTNRPNDIFEPLRHRFDMIECGSVGPNAMLERAKRILSEEKVKVPQDDNLRDILGGSDGSIRDMLRALDEYCIAARSSAL